MCVSRSRSPMLQLATASQVRIIVTRSADLMMTSFVTATISSALEESSPADNTAKVSRPGLRFRSLIVFQSPVFTYLDASRAPAHRPAHISGSGT